MIPEITEGYGLTIFRMIDGNPVSVSAVVNFAGDGVTITRYSDDGVNSWGPVEMTRREFADLCRIGHAAVGDEAVD